MPCLFCRIVGGEIPVEVIYEDDTLMIFPDIAPLAPVHLLVVPKVHIDSVARAEDHQGAILGQLFVGAKHAASSLGLSGYKTVVNVEKEGGQEIMHVHMHLLGGTTLSMPSPIQTA